MSKSTSPLDEIQAILARAGKKEHVIFAAKIVPGLQKVYGVKTPVLNELARKYRAFSFDLAQELWQAGALEERVIAVKILEKTGKDDPKRLLKLFRRFSATIDNWAVCDGLGMQSLRGIVKTQQPAIFALAEKLATSRNFWQRRLALVMVEWYTRLPGSRAAIRKIVTKLKNDEAYYVQKAVVWINSSLDKRKSSV